MTSTQIAEALFAAFEAGDADTIRELCSPDLKAVQNLTTTMTLDELIGFSSAVLGAVAAFRYVDPIRTETSSGAIEEHGVHVTLHDGTEITIAASVVLEIEDGRIVELRETVDGAAAAPLLQALAPSS